MIPITYNFLNYGERTLYAFNCSRDWLDCQRCISVTPRNVVIGCGHPRADILFVGEGPWTTEDRFGVPFVGDSGDLLNNFLSTVELDRKDVFVDNLVGCLGRDGDQPRVPTPLEVKTCSKRLNELIIELDPLLIVALGKTVLRALTKEVLDITKMRGEVLVARVPGVLVVVEYPMIATFHPAFILRNPEDPKNKRQRAQSLKMRSLRDYEYAVRLVKFLNHLYGRKFNVKKE